jgi:hypothetical protein
VASKLRKDAANLARAVVDMPDALDPERGKGPQVVRVERVVVNEGRTAAPGVDAAADDRAGRNVRMAYPRTRDRDGWGCAGRRAVSGQFRDLGDHAALAKIGLAWGSGEIDAQTQHRAFRCRPRTELGATDRSHLATIASAGTNSCAG